MKLKCWFMHQKQYGMRGVNRIFAKQICFVFFLS